METAWKFDWAKPEEFEDFRKKSEIAHDSFRDKWSNRTDYLEDAGVLRKALDEFELLMREYKHGGPEGFYYSMKRELDQANPEIRQRLLSIDEFTRKQSHKIVFFEIILSKVSSEKQKEFLESSELKEYKNFLKNIFDNAKHILSEEAEKILSLKSTGSYELWVQMVEGLLAQEMREVVNEDGEKVSMNYNQLINLMRSNNKRVRDEAQVALDSILGRHEEVAEVEINAVLEEAKVEDELRGYSRPDENRMKGDYIDVEFIEAILSAVKEKFSISRKYYSLVSKLVGQEKIGYHERNVEIGKVNKKYSFEESVELVKKVFSKLDEEFVQIFEKMLEEGRIDAFPKKGKNGGAFCAGSSKNDPIHVLLNHTESLRDVTTIAHEMGHAINDSFMQEKENSLNFSHPKSTAEVASTFMEDFVFDEILESATEEERFYLLFTRIREDLQSIQRQIALYFFELEIHKVYREEGYLSKEKIEEIFVKHMSEYMGDYVDLSTGRLGWVYWSHIRYYFYVYSYASGLLISKAMQAKYRKDKNFIIEIKKFLSTGTSKMPREIFKEMGIEINKEFFLEGLSEIEKNLEEVEELGKKLGKF